MRQPEEGRAPAHRDRPAAAAPVPARPVTGRPVTAAPTGGSARSLGFLQQAAGNTAVSGLVTAQRQTPAPATTPAAAPAATVTLGGYRATSYSELLAIARLFAAELRTETAEVPAGQAARVTADELIVQARAWASYLAGKGGEPLSQAATSQAQVWYADFVAARKGLEDYKKAKARDDLRRAVADADAARALLDKIPEEFADLQRGAFLAEDHKLLEDILHVLAPALQVSSALLEVHEKATDVITWLGKETSHASEIVEKAAPFVEAAHKVVAGIEVLSGALTLLRGGKGSTEIDKSFSKLGAGFTVAGGVGSLTGFASAYMVYFGVVLSVGRKIAAMAATIVREHANQLNRFFMSTGDLDSVDWRAEPGGRATFEFMVLVMRAGGWTDIPTPIPGAVDELIVDAIERLEKGTGEDVPTTGFWFWKSTDPSKIRTWLFGNRRNIWAMLYGSVTPP